MAPDDAFWNKRKCLVTGGMGFGGSHLCEQLIHRGAITYVLDRFRPARSYLVLTGLVDDMEYISGDVRDLELLKFLLHRYEIDTVFHLAAQPIVPMSVALPYETLSVTVSHPFRHLHSDGIATFGFSDVRIVDLHRVHGHFEVGSVPLYVYLVTHL